MKPVLLGFCVLAFSFAHSTASGFSELIRHGYNSCMACHVSPNGGGVLTQYGKSLSGEVLSTWHKEGEEQFLYGFLKSNEYLQVGGDIRMVQSYRDTPTTKDARFTFMQSDLEAALTLSPFTVAGTLGYLPKTDSTPAKLFSPKHYALFSQSSLLNIRLGKFQRAYGINSPEHQLSVRRRLGLEPGTEAYNIELSSFPEPYELFLTATIANPEIPSSNQERGATVRVAQSWSNLKLGLSYAFLKSELSSKHQTGPYLQWVMTKELLVHSEIDFQWKEDAKMKMRSVCASSKLDYEWTRGVHNYLFHEADWLKDGEPVHSLGLGFQFFPRPHLEINALYSRTLKTSDKNTEQAFLLLHYYL